MPVIHDKEFGNITIRRSSIANQIRIKVAPNGTLNASLPMRTPMFFVKHLLKNSRNELRSLLSHAKPEYEYKDGMQIGKSHSLAFKNTENNEFNVSRRGQKIIINLPNEKNINDPLVSRKIRDVVIAAIRIEAKSYLPKRLSYLAQKYGYIYKKVRFSHASGRWGSYSSNGTISLNIALMKLPFELIDYVIIHELTHSKQMNHSKRFWSLVECADPDYKQHRKSLKLKNPSI